MDSMGNMVGNNVLTSWVTAGKETHCGDHVTTQTNVESLLHT